MKILLSAYACEPDRGSEPGVGWNWAIELAKLGHTVWVITRANNREVITKNKINDKTRENIHFIYYDLPKWVSFWKKGARGVHLYYLLWQILIFPIARKLHRRLKFDIVHHVTFVSVRQPSFLGLLGVHFIFGPVGGGESVPYRLRVHFGWRAIFRECLRDVANYLVKFDPLMHITFFAANKIYVTSLQTKSLIPFFYRDKVTLQLAIGIDASSIMRPKLQTKVPENTIKLLYIGRFIYWKGMGIGLRAFAQFLDVCPHAQLTMVGEGPDENRWKALAKKLQINHAIIWRPWLPQNMLTELYLSHDLFLYPSLRDSGGMVVLEALSKGLPVLCFDLGGPGQIIDNQCGYKVKPDCDHISATKRFRDFLLELDGNRLKVMKEHAIRKSTSMTWSSIVGKVYHDL